MCDFGGPVRDVGRVRREPTVRLTPARRWFAGWPQDEVWVRPTPPAQRGRPKGVGDRERATAYGAGPWLSPNGRQARLTSPAPCRVRSGTTEVVSTGGAVSSTRSWANYGRADSVSPVPGNAMAQGNASEMRTPAIAAWASAGVQAIGPTGPIVGCGAGGRGYAIPHRAGRVKGGRTRPCRGGRAVRRVLQYGALIGRPPQCRHHETRVIGPARWRPPVSLPHRDRPSKFWRAAGGAGISGALGRPRSQAVRSRRSPAYAASTAVNTRPARIDRDSQVPLFRPPCTAPVSAGELGGRQRSVAGVHCQRALGDGRRP